MVDNAGAQERLADAARPNILNGILMGLVASAACCLIWYGWVVLTHLVWFFGVLLFGIVIGVAVRAGAGDRPSLFLQWVAGVLALCAMLVSQYLIVRHDALKLLAEQGVTQLPLILPFGTMAEMVWAGLKSPPFEPLLWLASILVAAMMPGKELGSGKAPASGR